MMTEIFSVGCWVIAAALAWIWVQMAARAIFKAYFDERYKFIEKVQQRYKEFAKEIK